jgi:hypothetical protein
LSWQRKTLKLRTPRTGRTRSAFPGTERARTVAPTRAVTTRGVVEEGTRMKRGIILGDGRRYGVALLIRSRFCERNAVFVGIGKRIWVDISKTLGGYLIRILMETVQSTVSGIVLASRPSECRLAEVD